MVTAETIREKLENKLFSKIGKTVTFISKVSPTTDMRGDIVAYGTDSTSETKIVPYNIVSSRETFEAFGTMNQGEMDAAVRYNLSIKLNDLFVIDSVRYLIKDIAYNYLPDNVVTIVRISKEQA